MLELARGQLAVVADRGVADELADLLRVLGRDLRDELQEEPADELARVFERREHLLLGPGGEPAAPEVVVLVEALLLALGEVRAAAGEPLLELGELLVAVDVDPLDLGLDLVLEVVQVLRARLVVDVGDDRSGEVEDLLELARSDVEQVADAARDALEEPDVRDRSGQVDVTHALAAHLLAGHLDAAALADDALVADALVLAAVALPVLGRTENALAEQAVALGLERAVVDRLRLGDLAGRPVADLLARRKPDPDRVELVDVDQCALASFCFRSCDGLQVGRSVGAILVLDLEVGRPRSLRPARRRASSSSSGAFSSAAIEILEGLLDRQRQLAVGVDDLLALLDLLACRRARRRPQRAGREVDAELFRGAEQLVVLLADLDLAAVLGDHLTSSARDCISLSSTLNDSGIDGSAMFSPLTIAS